MHSRKGFTLIEIIIVVVIIGVLAGLALPRLTSQIDKGIIPEALATMGLMFRDLDMCYQTSDTPTGCRTTAASTKNFKTYTYVSPVSLVAENSAGTGSIIFELASGVSVISVSKKRGTGVFGTIGLK